MTDTGETPAEHRGLRSTTASALEVRLDLTTLTLLALGMGSLVIGGAIGTIGVGGVLLVPLLLLVGGLSVHDAVAVAMWGYLFTGAAGTLAYGVRREIPWLAAAWMGVAAVPGAVVGSLVVRWVDGASLTTALAIFLGLSALDTLRGPSDATGASFACPGLLPRGRTAVVGALTGFGSAATGTSGPVIGLPLLLHLRVPPKSAVALCQAVQLPIAVFASATNVTIGTLDLALASSIGTALAVGVTVGAASSSRLPSFWLRRGIALGLLVSTVLLLFNTLS